MLLVGVLESLCGTSELQLKYLRRKCFHIKKPISDQWAFNNGPFLPLMHDPS